MQGYRFCLANPVSSPDRHVVSSRAKPTILLSPPPPILVSVLPTSARALCLGRGRDPEIPTLSQPPQLLRGRGAKGMTVLGLVVFT